MPSFRGTCTRLAAAFPVRWRRLHKYFLGAQNIQGQLLERDRLAQLPFDLPHLVFGRSGYWLGNIF